jgi:hypothetical protein
VKKNRKGLGLIKGLMLLLVVTLIAVAGLSVHRNHQETTAQSIDSYQACTTKYPVQQSYPSVCSVPGGRSFTNPAEKAPQAP